MRITADTNILVRTIVEDDAEQAETARRLLAAASLIVVPVPVLCELVWVLRSGYRLPSSEIARAIQTLADVDTVQLDRSAVDAGLASLAAGGDFADGAIADLGRRSGGDRFVSFERRAIGVLDRLGLPAATPETILARQGLP